MSALQSPIPDEGLIGTLGWVDVTALVVLLVFFVLGIFRGALWQISRIVTLVLAYWLSVRYGPQIAPTITGWFSADIEPRVPLFLSFLLVFLGVLIVVSILTVLLEKLLRGAGLTFYNRLGGGALGLATGALVVIAGLTAFMMFLGKTEIAQAAEGSHSRRIGAEVLRLLGDYVPAEVRELYGIEAPGAGEGPPASDGPPSDGPPRDGK